MSTRNCNGTTIVLRLRFDYFLLGCVAVCSNRLPPRHGLSVGLLLHPFCIRTCKPDSPFRVRLINLFENRRFFLADGIVVPSYKELLDCHRLNFHLWYIPYRISGPVREAAVRSRPIEEDRPMSDHLYRNICCFRPCCLRTRRKSYSSRLRNRRSGRDYWILCDVTDSRSAIDR